MKLTIEWLKEKQACSDGYRWAIENIIGLEPKYVIKVLIKNDKISWANWYVTRMISREQCIKYAIFSAREVLDIFEKKYPNDLRPRQAIEAAEKYLKEPTEDNKKAAAYAACAADAADAAAYAAYAAAYAADAAAYAACAADAAADAAYVKLKLQKKILKYGLKLINEK